MTDDETFPFDPDWTVPTGAVIEDYCDENRVTPRIFAVMTRLSEEYVKELIAGRAELTEQAARSIAGATGMPLAFLLRYEARYRADLAAGKKVI